MKKLLAVLLAAGVLTVSYAEKPKFEPYGFVKGDMYYTAGGVKSWGQPSITSASQATGVDSNAIGFTAQHTRFGLKGAGATGDISMGGLIELDFFVIAANANAKPRMRLAYAWVKPIKGLEIRTGQQWDLFSPLNPTTNNPNANLWFNGNYGFRRTQMMAQYGMDLGSVKPCIQVSAGETAREDDLAVSQKTDSTKAVTVGTWLGDDNKSGVPMMQGRLAATFLKNMEVGVAGVYGAYGSNSAYTTTGISIDANLPLHKLFALKAEYGMGANLNNANLFSVGGNGKKDTAVETNGFWVEAISKPLSYLNVVLGAANESVTSAVAAAKVESNMTVYGDLVFPIGEFFSLSIEYQMISTSIKGQTDPNVANVINIAGKVAF